MFDQAEKDHRQGSIAGTSALYGNSALDKTGSQFDGRTNTELDAASSNLRASNITSYLDIDIEEVDDRLEELQFTLDAIEENENGNRDILKVHLTSYCEEKCKILRLLYRFMTVRSVREDPEAMGKIEGQKQSLNEINQKVNKISTRCKLNDAMKADEKKFAIKYKLADLEAKCNQINEAFDVIKTPRSETQEMQFLRKVKRDML